MDVLDNVRKNRGNEEKSEFQILIEELKKNREMYKEAIQQGNVEELVNSSNNIIELQKKIDSLNFENENYDALIPNYSNPNLTAFEKFKNHMTIRKYKKMEALKKEIEEKTENKEELALTTLGDGIIAKIIAFINSKIAQSEINDLQNQYNRLEYELYNSEYYECVHVNQYAESLVMGYKSYKERFNIPTVQRDDQVVQEVNRNGFQLNQESHNKGKEDKGEEGFRKKYNIDYDKAKKDSVPENSNELGGR